MMGVLASGPCGARVERERVGICLLAVFFFVVKVSPSGMCSVEISGRRYLCSAYDASPVPMQ